jgi:shikimate dehydrogenase
MRRPGRLVLLGHPVAHSLSPRFQNAALQAAGIPLVYEPLDVAPSDFVHALERLRRIGGAGNVTIPHKEAAAAHCGELTPVARRAGAVNTFWVEGERLVGDNTDVAGFETAVAELYDAFLLTSRPEVIAVFGAGGAAAAVLSAIERWPNARARVWSRTSERTHAICARFARIAEPMPSTVEAVRGAQLVVNATPVGLADDEMPIDPRSLDAGTLVLDLVYRRDGTAWTRAARGAGLRASDGTTMLIEQGARSFERWFGLVPDRAAMREALIR